MSGPRFEDLRTPCALVDLDVAARNCRRMSDRATDLGVQLRPHVKTHKCIPGARLQVEGHSGGITVSTLAEAEHFGRHGFGDITYAFPLAIPHIPDALALHRELDRLQIVVDHPVVVDAVETRALEAGITIPAFLKVDCGYHRAGVDPAARSSVELARRLEKSRGIEFRGLLAHAGHSYGCENREEILTVAHEERDVMVGFADRLREAGIEVPEVSVGSTPTMSVVDDLEGITEIRPGNYIFYDEHQHGIGSCHADDVALSVLTTVVASYPERNLLIVDAGALALSKDPGATHLPGTRGFGVVMSASGRDRHTDLEITTLSQEHGWIRGRARDEPSTGRRATRGVAAHPVGSRLRISPHHSCLTAAAHDVYRGVRNGQLIEEWRPHRGW